MNELALGLWERARDSLRVVRHDLSLSAVAAASRACYPAFYAVSAHFALSGWEFRRHSGVEAGVHRDLVKKGTWPRERARSTPGWSNSEASATTGT